MFTGITQGIALQLGKYRKITGFPGSSFLYQQLFDMDSSVVRISVDYRHNSFVAEIGIEHPAVSFLTRHFFDLVQLQKKQVVSSLHDRKA